MGFGIKVMLVESGFYGIGWLDVGAHSEVSLEYDAVCASVLTEWDVGDPCVICDAILEFVDVDELFLRVFFGCALLVVVMCDYGLCLVIWGVW